MERYYNYVKKIPIEKLFIFIALTFGLLYVFLLPPFQSVDEGMHFYRTYQISTGRLIAKKVHCKIGDELPKSLSSFYEIYVPFIRNINKKTTTKDITHIFKLPLEKDNMVFTEFANTALYSPVCYLTQLPGVMIAKALNSPLAVIYYAGRLSNLLSYCLLVYFAIKIIPFFKLPMLLLSLMPMSLSLAGAFTCDVAVLGLNFLWIALILRLIVSYKDNKMSPRNIPAIITTAAFLAFLIALTKSYILLLPLIFLIPFQTFKTRKQYILFMTSVIFAAIAGFSIWSLYISGLTLNMNTTCADVTSQIIFIKTHPLQYIGILLKTFVIKTPRLIITMIGVLGWQDVKLDWITYIIYPILIYFSVATDNFNFKLRKWQKHLIIINTVIGTIITYTSLYLMWSPVGNNVVLGLNGKYFIPMMLPLLLLFKNNTSKLDYENVKMAILICLILILFSSEMSLLHRFYNITPQLYYKI